MSWAALVEGFRDGRHGRLGVLRRARHARPSRSPRPVGPGARGVRTHGSRCTSATPSRSSACRARWHDDHDREPAPTHTSSDFADELLAVLLDAGASEDELAAAPAPTGRRRGRRFRALAVPDRMRRRRRPRRRAGVGHRRRVDARPHARPPLLPRSRAPHPAVGRPRAGHDHAAHLDLPPRPCRRPARGLPRVAAEGRPPRRRRSAARPPHRFADLAQRIDELTRHHHDHLANIEAILATGPASLWEIAARLTWNRPWDQYPLGAAPLRGQRDGGPPALPRPSWARDPAEGRAARTRSLCPRAPSSTLRWSTHERRRPAARGPRADAPAGRRRAA